VSRVAIFTDSASDFDPAQAAAAGITIVPLLVTFGAETFKAGVDLSTEAFWERMIAPDAGQLGNQHPRAGRHRYAGLLGDVGCRTSHQRRVR